MIWALLAPVAELIALADTDRLELFDQGLDRARSDGTITRLEQQFLGAAPAGS